jgi:hypothetical protein
MSILQDTQTPLLSCLRIPISVQTAVPLSADLHFQPSVTRSRVTPPRIIGVQVP